MVSPSDTAVPGVEAEHLVQRGEAGLGDLGQRRLELAVGPPELRRELGVGRCPVELGLQRRVRRFEGITPALPGWPIAALQSAASSIGVEVSPANVRDADEIERSIATFARTSNGGLIVTTTSVAIVHRELILELAARHKLPAIFWDRFYVSGGGLISYGADTIDQCRRAADYVDRILKGERPADLPVQAATKYQLVINLKTARMLGLDSAVAACPRRRGDRMMRRREFVSLLGGAAAAWPSAARAQQEQTRASGLSHLSSGRPTDPVGANLRRQFLLGLRDLGYVEGRHFQIEQRSAEGHFDRLPGFARELADLPVDMLVVGGEASIRAAMQATDKIPIIMALAPDPVGSGFVTSLARPGGNVTGISALAPELAGKRVELLKEIIPRAVRVAVLWNPSSQAKVTEWQDTLEPARRVGLALRPFEARSPEEIDSALAAIGRDLPDALLTLTDGLTIAFRQRIGSFALVNWLPMISEVREFADAGGVATYGVNRADLWRRSASYVDKICAARSRATCRSSSRRKFELVINLNTAKALGLDVPPTLLARADEVIE